MTEKPYRGALRNWFKYEVGDGYIIRGTFDGHPYFHGESGHTSRVLSHDEVTGEIETRNSRYTLIGAPLA